MAKKKAATLNAGRSAGIIIAIAGILGLVLTHVTHVSRVTRFFMLFLYCASLITCLVSDFCARARITLTDAGIQLRIRRTGETHAFPWTDFSCLYELPGWKMSIYLFTPAPMDKDAQLAAYKACCRNKDVPYTHGGCLILNAQVHASVIDLYIPPHIQRMPWQQCARL